MAKIDAPVLTPSAVVPAVTTTKAVPTQWVTVPQEDAFEFTHPPIMINGEKYGPGKHFVTADIAFEIERLVSVFAKGQVRLIRNGQDKAVRARMNAQAASQGGTADPSNVS
jgi:hypothetical protein